MQRISHFLRRASEILHRFRRPADRILTVSDPPGAVRDLQVDVDPVYKHALHFMYSAVHPCIHRRVCEIGTGSAVSQSDPYIAGVGVAEQLR